MVHVVTIFVSIHNQCRIKDQANFYWLLNTLARLTGHQAGFLF